MMFTATRKFTFDAGHRVLGHTGKCRFIHGHTYTAEVTVKSDVNSLGMVIDFAVLKARIGDWINIHWDHNFLCHRDDPLLGLDEQTSLITYREAAFGGRAPYVMGDGNPTAENMAKELYTVASALLKHFDISVTRVRIHETPNCFADYTGE
jgi:6-pyruvoyltetrahydropterin/6-carboxytetrahydropterin synthase